MRSIVNLGTKLSFAALSVLLSVSCAVANTLSEVQINAEESGYGIVLKTDESAQIKKIVSSDDKVTLELKDVEVSPELNTVYNNAANIENVTIAPASKSGIKIVLKGEGIANSKVYFESPKNIASSLNSSTQSIQLNAPVSSYTPVYNPEAFASEEDQTSNPQLNDVLTKMHVSKSMLLTLKRYAKRAIDKTKSGDINMMTVMGVIFIAAALLLRPKKKSMPVKQQQSLTGILSRPQKTSQMEREIGINRQLVNNMNLNKAADLSSNAVNAGYGMKAYQQSQKNPYTTSSISSTGVSGIARRKPLQSKSLASAPIKKQTLKNKPVASMSTPLKSQMPSMINPVASKKQAAKAKELEPSDLDSMKFLESITKIYEKNGRADLAKGLKDNLKKAQMSNHAVL